MIELFEHNRIAYDSALAMLAETGKSAIILPTGTGKSFIGFRYCEDFPDKTICWVSPSDYIFKTQLENLKAAADGYDHAKAYYEKHGDLNICSKKCVCDDGFDLYYWIATQRRAYKKGKMSDERISLLNKLGLIWDIEDKRWREMYEIAHEYYFMYGNLNIPFGYQSENGHWLGRWAKKQRVNRDKLKRLGANGDQVKRLEQIGIIWNDELSPEPIIRKEMEKVRAG